MKFWGVEVKSGEAIKVESGDGFLVHLSQASLGVVEKDKGSKNVNLYVKVGDRKKFLGILAPGMLPQYSFDLVFDQNFELSHSWKNGSVHFMGHQIPRKDEGDDYDEETDDGLPVVGKAELQGKQPKPDEDMDDSEDEEDDSSEDDHILHPSPMMVVGGYHDKSGDGESNDEDDETDAEDNESDDEDDETDAKDDESDKTPKMVELGKKRSAGSVAKTPLPEKKAKFVTSQKTEQKKGVGHVATPHPSKLTAKPSATSEQKQQQNHKPFVCKSSRKSFGSDIALQSHTKDKHGAAAAS